MLHTITGDCHLHLHCYQKLVSAERGSRCKLCNKPWLPRGARQQNGYAAGGEDAGGLAPKPVGEASVPLREEDEFDMEMAGPSRSTGNRDRRGNKRRSGRADNSDDENEGEDDGDDDEEEEEEDEVGEEGRKRAAGRRRVDPDEEDADEPETQTRTQARIRDQAPARNESRNGIGNGNAAASTRVLRVSLATMGRRTNAIFDINTNPVLSSFVVL